MIGIMIPNAFAEVYEVVIEDPATRTNVQCPPSVAVLGAFALNDTVAHPWFAPAGLNRGGLDTVIQAERKLTNANRDALYEKNVNPLATLFLQYTLCFGQIQ